MLDFHDLQHMFWENAWFFDKYAMKNYLQNKKQITFVLVAGKNIDFDHVCQFTMFG